jgi:hypothetical protein
MIVHYFIDGRTGIKKGSRNAYKINCMAERDGKYGKATPVHKAGIDEFLSDKTAELLSEEWLG